MNLNQPLDEHYISRLLYVMDLNQTPLQSENFMDVNKTLHDETEASHKCVSKRLRPRRSSHETEEILSNLILASYFVGLC